MATVGAESKDKKIECFYDPSYDNSTFLLTLPQNSNFIAVRVDKQEVDSMIEALQQFNKNMRFAGALK